MSWSPPQCCFARKSVKSPLIYRGCPCMIALSQWLVASRKQYTQSWYLCRAVCSMGIEHNTITLPLFVSKSSTGAKGIASKRFSFFVICFVDTETDHMGTLQWSHGNLRLLARAHPDGQIWLVDWGKGQNVWPRQIPGLSQTFLLEQSQSTSLAFRKDYATAGGGM